MVLGACALATGVVSADSPEPYQWLFQDSATSTAQVCVCVCVLHDCHLYCTGGWFWQDTGYNYSYRYSMIQDTGYKTRQST